MKEQKRESLNQEGDREFQKMYWAGWKKAIGLYGQSLEIQSDQNILQNLFFSLILITIREKTFHIRSLQYLDSAKIALGKIDKPLFQIYFQLAKEMAEAPYLWEPYVPHSRENRQTFAENLKNLSKNVLTDYQYFLFQQYYLYYAGKDDENRSEEIGRNFLIRFPNSNLLLGASEKDDAIDEKIKKHPDFIELIMIRANHLVKTGKLKEAEQEFRKIIDINPHIPDVFSGIGNIYFWLELYNIALDYYQQTLNLNSSYPQALFGKAICLHYLEKFENSNQVLDELIEKQSFYHGETYYYQALNYYYLKNPKKVEASIEKAIIYIPDSTDLNAFAGIYYFHNNDLEKAEHYLKRVFEHDVPHADAYFYTGLIALKKKKPAKHFFLSAAQFFYEDIKNQIIKLDQVDKINIHQDIMTKIKKKRLLRLKKTSRDYLEKLTKIIMYYKKAGIPIPALSDFKNRIETEIQNCCQLPDKPIQ